MVPVPGSCLTVLLLSLVLAPRLAFFFDSRTWFTLTFLLALVLGSRFAFFFLDLVRIDFVLRLS